MTLFRQPAALADPAERPSYSCVSEFCCPLLFPRVLLYHVTDVANNSLPPAQKALAGRLAFCNLLPSGQTWLTDSRTGGEVYPGPQFSPEAQVQAVIGCHLHRLIGGAYDVGAVGTEGMMHIASL